MLTSNSIIPKRATGEAGPFTIVIPGFESFAPSIEVSNNSLLYLARQEAFPGVKDYAGTISDDELTDQDLSSTPTAERIGLYTSATILGSAVANTGVNTIDDDTFTAVFEVNSSVTTNRGLLTFGSSGETEPTNFTYAVRLRDNATAEFFCEAGAGANREARWRIPDRIDTVDYAQIRFVRDAGALTCYYGSKQLKYVTSVTGGTDNGDGSVSNMAATGGSSAALGITDATDEVNPILLQIQDEPLPDADARLALVDWDDTDWEPSGVSSFATANTVVLLEPQSGGLADLAGLIDLPDWSVTGTEVNYYDDVWTTASSWTLSNARSVPELQITGDLTIDMAGVWEGVNGFYYAHSGGGETPDTNYLYGLSVSSTSIFYFSEDSSGSNSQVTWNLPAALEVGELFTTRLVRTAGGEVYLVYNGTLLSVTSTTGVDNGTSSTITSPTGGGSGQLGVGNGGGDDTPASGRHVRYLHIQDTAIVPSP